MSKLADIEITKLKEMAKSGTYDTWGNAWVFEMLDTIEALQQENEQLKSENASLRNWNACEEKLHNELLESDRRRIELESELEYEDSGLSPEQVQELAQAKGKDVVCHCNIKKNAELIAEILDYDVENEIAISLSLEEMKTYINAYEDYRELKEQGRLIVLPCQIGQKAWYIKDGNIDYGFARWFEESDGKWYASVQNEPKSMLFFEFDDFGKTIFLTRKAAEEALRKEQSYE